MSEKEVSLPTNRAFFWDPAVSHSNLESHDPSTLNDPEFVEKYPEYPVVAEQLPCADPDWRPLIPEWNELNIDVLGQALTERGVESIRPRIEESE